MKNKLIIVMTLCLFLITLLSACESHNQAQLPEIFNRGIKYNISEEQLLKEESDLTFETVDFSYQKTLTSNETVMINGDYAHICYTFINDKLKIIEYKIDVIYPKTQIEDIPAYKIYDKYKQLLTDEYGTPIENNFNDESKYFESYSLLWAKDVITPQIYVIQSVYSADYVGYPSEIDDYVTISFVYREDFTK